MSKAYSEHCPLINDFEGINAILGPDVPILFSGNQQNLTDMWDDGEGSFARIKKYKLPELIVVSVFTHHELS